MTRQQDLQVAVRERLRRLLTTHGDSATHEIRLVTDWIQAQPELATILRQADRAEPDLDFAAFDTALMASRGGMRWPSQTEAGRATLIWKLMQHLAAAYDRPGGEDAIHGYAIAVAWGTSKLNDAWHEFARRILEPLFMYLVDHVDADSSILHVLGRYVRMVEWFDRDDLHTRVEAEPRKTEEIYDIHLRRFLFSEGISMPFAQARSASGESDVLADLDSDDPLVCELKVFDAVNRDKGHIAAGVNQAIQYATDYAKPTAYLIIVDLSGRPIELPSDGDPKPWPPYLDIAGIRVNLIVVRALPTVSASKLGKPRPVVFTRADLTGPA